MRQRSKSLFIESRHHNSSLLNDNVDVEEWDVEDEFKLIIQIKNSLPAKEMLPYDESLMNFNWDTIKIKSYSPSQIQSKFESILQNLRTHRLLSEILKDAEKKLLSALPIQRPLNPYVLFIQENKEKIMAKNLEMHGNYVQTASDLFKSLDNKEKENYANKSKKIKIDYQTEMSKLYDDNREVVGSSDCGGGNPKKKLKEIVVVSPLTCYLKKKKKKDPNLNFRTAQKQYSGMTQNEKLKWILKFLGIPEGEMLSFDQFEQALKHLNKEEMAIVDDYEGRPKKLNAFNLYMKKHLSDLKNKSNNSVTWNENFKLCIESWKNLPESVKIQHQKESIELKKEYEIKLKHFLDSLPEDRRNYELMKFKVKNNALSSVSTNSTPSSKKRKIVEESDEGINEKIKKTNKKDKLGDDTENNTNIKCKNDLNKSNISLEISEFNLVKPPSSLYKYFVLHVFEGSSTKKAKKAFKKLPENELEKISKKYEKSKKKYLKKFETYLSSLPAEKISEVAKQINDKSLHDDDITDLSDFN